MSKEFNVGRGCVVWTDDYTEDIDVVCKEVNERFAGRLQNYKVVATGMTIILELADGFADVAKNAEREKALGYIDEFLLLAVDISVFLKRQGYYMLTCSAPFWTVDKGVEDSWLSSRIMRAVVKD